MCHTHQALFNFSFSAQHYTCVCAHLCVHPSHLNGADCWQEVPMAFLLPDWPVPAGYQQEQELSAEAKAEN